MFDNAESMYIHDVRDAREAHSLDKQQSNKSDVDGWYPFLPPPNSIREHKAVCLIVQSDTSGHHGKASVGIKLGITSTGRIVEYITKDCPSRPKVVNTVVPGIGYSAATRSGTQEGNCGIIQILFFPPKPSGDHELRSW